jgi:hypothetical protein
MNRKSRLDLTFGYNANWVAGSGKYRRKMLVEVRPMFPRRPEQRVVQTA